MPHSVVVATSTAAPPDRGTPPRFKGMTVSSFTTLTLTPMPIVTFNIRRPSQTLNAISESKQFLIHILSATESGARVADAFTRGNGRDVFRNGAFEVLRKRGGNATESLEPPLLAADGIIKVLRCRILEDQGLVDVGDHVLILGKVVSIIDPAPRKDAKVEERCLCYLDREYRQVGPVIEPPKNELPDNGHPSHGTRAVIVGEP
jgi:flavin reductase (DIM6/NTAB) family NADH-FMN oxidoreductase RutF